MPFMNGFLPVSIAMLLFCIAWGCFFLPTPKDWAPRFAQSQPQ